MPEMEFEEMDIRAMSDAELDEIIGGSLGGHVVLPDANCL